MQDRKYRAVADGIQKLVGVAGRGQGSGLRVAVSHNDGDDEVGIVEGRAESMRQAIAEFPALMDGAGRVGCAMAADASWKGELFEEFLEPDFGLALVGIDFRVGSFQIAVGQ